MATIRRSITIRAPVERVFAYLVEPTNLPGIWPSLIAVHNVEKHANGSSFDWDYKLLALKIRGHSDPVELVTNERLVSRSEKGIPTTFRWLFEHKAPNTVVALEVDYQVPMFGRLAEGLVGRVNEREADILLTNLKRTMEAN